MGLAQVSAAIKESDKPLHLEGAEAIGLIKTASSTQQITDSAAAATAFSIGEKTVNDPVGVGADENFSGVYDNTEVYSRLILTLSQ